MKRLLVFLGILLLVTTVSALSLTFQNPSDFTALTTCYHFGGSSTPCTWSHNTSGGNSYVVSIETNMILNAEPQLTTYFAFTNLNGYSGPALNIWLLDSSHNLIASHNTIDATLNDRLEMKVIGGQSIVYINGVQHGAPQTIPINPSYVGVFTYGGGLATDDYIYGSTENHNIFGSPESGYYLQKDFINPAASGLYNSSGSLASSNNMTSTYGFGDNASHTVILQDFYNGVTVGSVTIPAGKMAGTISWSLNDYIFNNANARTSTGYVTTITGLGKYSNAVPYIGNGATVTWSQPTYFTGDSATISYSIASGRYWNTALYDYSMKVIDIYGTVKSTDTITSQMGTISHTFSSTDNGVFYAELFLTPKAGGNAVLMNYGATTLLATFPFYGGVYDGETTLPIPNVSVNFTQSGIPRLNVTNTNGLYIMPPTFLTGGVVQINVSKSGYKDYQNTFTPNNARNTTINFALIPNNPVYTGVALLGRVTDTTYGNLVSGATVVITNGSESHTTTSNSVGYYRFDSLTPDTCYQFAANKTGYSFRTPTLCVMAVGT